MSTTVRFNANTGAQVAIAAPSATPIDYTYQTAGNTIQAQMDLLHGTEYKVDLKNVAWGSTSTDELINSYRLIDFMYLRIKLTVNDTGGNLNYAMRPTNFLGYNCIDTLTIYFPGCEPIYFTGRWLANRFIRFCNPIILNHFKKLWLMDERQAFMNDSGTNNKVVGAYYNERVQEMTAAGKFEFPLVIPIPIGTSLHAFGDQNKTHPFPLYALGNPLKISIKWQSSTHIGKILGINPMSALETVNLTTGSPTAMPVKLDSAEYRFIYADVKDENELKRVSLEYTYPFVSEDVQQTKSTAVTGRTGFFKTSGLNLAQMRNSEIKELWIKVLRKTDYDEGRFYNTLPINGIEVLYGGQKIGNYGDPDLAMVQHLYGNHNYSTGGVYATEQKVRYSTGLPAITTNVSARNRATNTSWVSQSLEYDALPLALPVGGAKEVADAAVSDNLVWATSAELGAAKYGALLSIGSGQEARPYYQYVIPFSWLTTAQMGDRNYVRGIPFAPNQVQLILYSDCLPDSYLTVSQDYIVMVEYQYAAKLTIQGGQCSLTL